MRDEVFERKIKKLYDELGGEKEYNRLDKRYFKEGLAKKVEAFLKNFFKKHFSSLALDYELEDVLLKKGSVLARCNLFTDKGVIPFEMDFNLELVDGDILLTPLYDKEKVDELQKKLGYKDFAVKVSSVGVYKVSALNEFEAVSKVVDELFEKVSSIEFYSRRFTKGNKDLLRDYILESGYVMEWDKYVNTKDITDFSEEKVLPEQVIKFEKKATYYPESVLLSEEKSILDRFFSEEEQKVYLFLREKEMLKRTIASLIENHLKTYGIDAEVEIKSLNGDKMVNGVFELTSSYVSGEFPFVAEIENNDVKLLSIRDYEIKKLAGLKVYKIKTPDEKEFTILATSLPVVLETLQTILNKKITFDEFVKTYSFSEIGEFGVIDDAKQVNPWTKIKVEGEEFLIRLK